MAPPVPVYISEGSLLHHFELADVLFGGEVPDSRSVFECRSDICLVIVRFDWSWAVGGVMSKKSERAIWFLCDCSCVMVPGQFAVDIYA